jgi:hypothetical protein
MKLSIWVHFSGTPWEHVLFWELHGNICYH